MSNILTTIQTHFDPHNVEYVKKGKKEIITIKTTKSKRSSVALEAKDLIKKHFPKVVIPDANTSGSGARPNYETVEFPALLDGEEYVIKAKPGLSEEGEQKLRGANATAMQECLTAYTLAHLAANQSDHRTIVNSAKPIADTGKAKCSIPINNCVKYADENPDWGLASVQLARAILDHFGHSFVSKYEVHRDSKFVNDLRSAWVKTKSKMDFNKFNPADIWLVKQGTEQYINDVDTSSPEAFKHFINTKYKDNEWIGISLKKPKDGGAHANIFNDGKSTMADIDIVRPVSTPTSTNARLIFKIGNSHDRGAQVRSSSNDGLPQMEIENDKGSKARHGKIGFGILNKFLADGDGHGHTLNTVSKNTVPSTIPEIARLAKVFDFDDKTAQSFAMFAHAWLDGGKAEGPDALLSKPKVLNKLMSMQLVANIATAPKNVGNSVFTKILQYASSQTPVSSIFLKVA